MELYRYGLLCAVLVCLFVYGRTDGTCNNDNCYATNGNVCNGQGSCDCGVCTCDAPFRGPTCEECPTCRTPCELFKGCVGCKIFGTGFMGIMECLSNCDYMANYIPVEGGQFDIEDENSDHMLCKHTNENMCVESFKIGAMTDGYRDLYVRTEMECIELPTLPPYVPVEATTIEQTTEEPEVTTDAMASFTSPTTTKEAATSATTETLTTVKPPTSTDKATPSETPTVQSTKYTSLTKTQMTTESVADSSEKPTKEIDSDNSSENEHDSVDDDDKSDVVEIDVDIKDSPNDEPEETGPISGSDNYSSGGDRGSYCSVASVILTIMCSLYYLTNLH